MWNGQGSAFKAEEAFICIHVKCEILSKIYSYETSSSNYHQSANQSNKNILMFFFGGGISVLIGSFKVPSILNLISMSKENNLKG